VRVVISVASVGDFVIFDGYGKNLLCRSSETAVRYLFVRG